MENDRRSCFTDLNVIAQDAKRTNEELLQMLGEYGYEKVALSKEVMLAKKVQLKAATALCDLIDDIPVSKNGNRLQILQRLTVTVEDSSLLHALSSPALDSYDLLAIRPKTDKVFQQACGTLNIDIISVDLTERLPFNFKRAQVGQAIERGVCFEICYSPAIRDTTARRNTLANAMELVKVSKGKNVILSSQAERVFELRAPADVANLCHLFGMSGRLCKATITSACRGALLHAAMRRSTAKGVVSSISLKRTKDDVDQADERKTKGKQQKRKSTGKEKESVRKKAKLSTVEQTD